MIINFFKTVIILIVMLFSIQIPIAEAAPLEGKTTVNLNLRASPSTGGKLIQTLKKGTTVKYATHNKSWHKVYVKNRVYYASSAYIKRTTGYANPKVKPMAKLQGVTKVNLNVRTSANTKAKIIKTLKKGTSVQYTNHNSSWAKVYLNGKTYYAAKTYIAQKGAASKPPAAKPPAAKPPAAKPPAAKPPAAKPPAAKPPAAKPPAAKPPASKPPVVKKEQGYTKQSVNLYERALQASPIARVLPKSTAIVYSKYDASWSIVYIGSESFYTLTTGLSSEKPQTTPIMKPHGSVYTNTPGDVLNVRSSASPKATILGKLAHSTLVEHYGSKSGFYKIKYNGKEGYIASTHTITTKPKMTVIVLDAGHGGRDPGAVNGSLYEKTIVLDVTKRVETYLRSKYGYQVRLTRSTDIYLTLDQRVQTAKTLRGNLFVSLHTNAATTPYAKGVETFYSSSSAHSGKSRVLATNIQSNLMGNMSGMTSRGVKTANYYVIRYNTMPSALVELGFISSPQDVTHLRSNASRQRMAEGIAEGIAQYVHAYH